MEGFTRLAMTWRLFFCCLLGLLRWDGHCDLGVSGSFYRDGVKCDTRFYFPFSIGVLKARTNEGMIGIERIVLVILTLSYVVFR